MIGVYGEANSAVNVIVSPARPSCEPTGVMLSSLASPGPPPVTVSVYTPGCTKISYGTIEPVQCCAPFSRKARRPDQAVPFWVAWMRTTVSPSGAATRLICPKKMGRTIPRTTQNARKTGRPRFSLDSCSESRQLERACSGLPEDADFVRGNGHDTEPRRHSWRGEEVSHMNCVTCRVSSYPPLSV